VSVEKIGGKLSDERSEEHGRELFMGLLIA
jgi:hypothetical protein